MCGTTNCLYQSHDLAASDSSAGRVEDCRGAQQASLGRWFKSGLEDCGSWSVLICIVTIFVHSYHLKPNAFKLELQLAGR